MLLYCAGLGIEPAQFWNNGQGRALILSMGNATLEIFDETQAQTIDQIEAGQRVSGQIRFALQVPDLKAAMERLLAHGATLVHPPIITPWGDYNVRLRRLRSAAADAQPLDGLNHINLWRNHALSITEMAAYLSRHCRRRR